MKAWKCADCGYETDSRCLMCPECTTSQDWDDIVKVVEGMTIPPAAAEDQEEDEGEPIMKPLTGYDVFLLNKYGPGR